MHKKLLCSTIFYIVVNGRPLGKPLVEQGKLLFGCMGKQAWYHKCKKERRKTQ